MLLPFAGHHRAPRERPIGGGGGQGLPRGRVWWKKEGLQCKQGSECEILQYRKRTENCFLFVGFYEPLLSFVPAGEIGRVT